MYKKITLILLSVVREKDMSSGTVEETTSSGNGPLSRGLGKLSDR